MYNASKQALRVLTEGLRHELAVAGDGHIKASVSLFTHTVIHLHLGDLITDQKTISEKKHRSKKMSGWVLSLPSLVPPLPIYNAIL